MSLQPIVVPMTVEEPNTIPLGNEVVIGPAGPPGPPGPPGPSGASLQYVHTQSVASDTWEITHDLDKYPSVTVVDSGGNVVVGDVRYIDTSNIVVTFRGAFSGVAYLN